MAIKKIIILFLFIVSVVESVDKEALKDCGQLPKACTFTLDKPDRIHNRMESIQHIMRSE